MLSHLRSNAVGYLALFIALGGGAYAATAGPNTVDSASIRNGQVRSADVRNDSLTGADINESTLRGGLVPRKARSGAGYVVRAANGARIGTLLGGDDSSLEVITRTRYLASFDWQGHIFSDSTGIFAAYSGPDCTGTRYIPAPTTGNGPLVAAGRELRFRSGNQYVVAVASTATQVQVLSYDSFTLGCKGFGSPTASLAWPARSLSPAEAGLPVKIAGPLRITRH